MGMTSAKFPGYWEGFREGYREGFREGFLEGAVRAQRGNLVLVLHKKFGRLPARTLRRIEATAQLELLDGWFEQALDAKKLDEVSFDAKILEDLSVPGHISPSARRNRQSIPTKVIHEPN